MLYQAPEASAQPDLLRRRLSRSEDTWSRVAVLDSLHMRTADETHLSPASPPIVHAPYRCMCCAHRLSVPLILRVQPNPKSCQTHLCHHVKMVKIKVHQPERSHPLYPLFAPVWAGRTASQSRRQMVHDQPPCRTSPAAWTRLPGSCLPSPCSTCPSYSTCWPTGEPAQLPACHAEISQL